MRQVCWIILGWTLVTECLFRLNSGSRIRFIPQIEKLSVAEKILLVEDIGDSISSEEFAIPVPQSHMKEQDFRLCLLRQFPYAIYFTIENEQVIVFGLFHCAHNPQAINAELQNGRKIKTISSSMRAGTRGQPVSVFKPDLKTPNKKIQLTNPSYSYGNK
ncbi:MAG: addiction module protein [Planctomycetia bacterium]|nr:addiction module protein [Planctomycetia bacterium]